MTAWVRVLGSAALTYLFIIVLMTASAQMRVVQTLADMQPKQEYSFAYSNLVDANGDLEKFQADEDKYRAELDKAVQAREAAKFPYLDAAAPLRTLVADINASRACKLRTDWNVEETAVILGDLRRCVRNPKVERDNREQAQKVLASSGDMAVKAKAWAEAIAQIDAANDGLKQARDGIDKNRHDRDALRGAFAEMSVLKASWFLGLGVLVELPPSMMQILLALSSGMFGGLLLTLILVVYPTNKFSLQSQGGAFGERILLGGLTAVAVFIMIGSGAAVLGSNPGITEGKANMLAFSAVGVLAGMFSDRVAKWLSDRADNFLGAKSPPAG